MSREEPLDFSEGERRFEELVLDGKAFDEDVEVGDVINIDGESIMFPLEPKYGVDLLDGETFFMAAPGDLDPEYTGPQNRWRRRK